MSRYTEMCKCRECRYHAWKNDEDCCTFGFKDIRLDPDKKACSKYQDDFPDGMFRGEDGRYYREIRAFG